MTRKHGFPVVHQGKCRVCGKLCFASRRDARSWAKSNFPGEHFSAYSCGDTWHYGHLPRNVRNGSAPQGRGVLDR